MSEKHDVHYHGPALVPHAIYAKKVESLSQENERLRELATKDQLSGALNRHGLEVYLETAKTPKALLLIDATNFKAVNDKFGHNAGDQLIIDTYSLLQRSIRPTDIIARWGGDEFVIILNGEDDEPVLDTNITEERRSNDAHIDHIDPVKQRIAEQVKIFLEGKPELREVNFDLAVGSEEWTNETDIKSLIGKLEAELNAHKAEQHQHGQYRKA